MIHKTIIPLASADRIIRNACPDTRVSDNAILELAKTLEEYGTRISLKALEFCKHAKRNTIKEEDIVLAIAQV